MQNIISEETRETVQYLKGSEEGVREMCQIVEEYAKGEVNLERIEIVKNLISNGASDELIVNSISLSLEEVA